MDTQWVLENAKKVFFKAMLDGYFGECKNSVKSTSNDGNTKIITFTEGDFRVVDEYHTTPSSEKSAGTTTIFYRGAAVWWMAYGGEYPGRVIPFLKEVLRTTYENGIFNKGRGPESYSGGKRDDTIWLTYRCIGQISGWHSFHKFEGLETITEIKGVGPSQVRNELGHHYCMGMSLI